MRNNERLYLIAYELAPASTRDRAPFFAKLKEWKAVPLFPSQWLVMSARDATSLFMELGNPIDAADRVLVAELTTEAFGTAFVQGDPTILNLFSRARVVSEPSGPIRDSSRG